jgi:hypothetical protein
VLAMLGKEMALGFQGTDDDADGKGVNIYFK